MMTIPFEEWLHACAYVAMESEWCIDASWPRWRELYDKGFSAGAAVDELFKEVARRECPNTEVRHDDENP